MIVDMTRRRDAYAVVVTAAAGHAHALLAPTSTDGTRSSWPSHDRDVGAAAAAQEHQVRAAGDVARRWRQASRPGDLDDLQVGALEGGARPARSKQKRIASGTTPDSGPTSSRTRETRRPAVRSATRSTTLRVSAISCIARPFGQ